MASLLFFIESDSPIYRVQDVPESAGLGNVLSGAQIAGVDCYKGPEGKRGAVIAMQPKGGSAAKCGYYPDKQTWKDAGTYWIGFETDNRPTPQELAREQQIDGFEVELNDGHSWVVPIVHATFSTLPQGYKVKGDDIEFCHAPQYADIMKRAEQWHDLLYANIDSIVDDTKEELRFAVDCLALNYRINLAIAGTDCLDLIRLPLIVRLILFALGAPLLERELAAKKKSDTAPPGTEVSPGDAA